ncbi:MAG: class I SAM-dependent methyltransferase [Candidatus Eremiobacteraeota bacterium]|nr:class I SAM-dependent methyltransferase [Candidatus Eremiobacteraeota bacterium]
MPHAYDEYLVPRLYTPWARKLLETAKLGPNHHLLDVACGTGAVARLAGPVVGMRGRVVACDLSRPMLDAARAHHRLPTAAGIEYFEVAAEELPFEDRSFQVVTVQHGLQYFKQRGRAVAQISRVLQKGGRIGASIWGSLETCHFWHALAIAFKKSIPPLNEELLKANAFTGAEALGELLEAVGFIKVEIHTEKMPMVFRRRCCAGSASRARHTLRSEDIRVGYHPARVRSGGETGL